MLARAHVDCNHFVCCALGGRVVVVGGRPSVASRIVYCVIVYHQSHSRLHTGMVSGISSTATNVMRPPPPRANKLWAHKDGEIMH